MKKMLLTLSLALIGSAAVAAPVQVPVSEISTIGNGNAIKNGAALIADGDYMGSAVRMARILRVTIEGLWLDLMTMADPYPVGEALITARTCAALCFPDHFDATGPKRPG